MTFQAIKALLEPRLALPQVLHLLQQHVEAGALAPFQCVAPGAGGPSRRSGGAVGPCRTGRSAGAVFVAAVPGTGLKMMARAPQRTAAFLHRWIIQRVFERGDVIGAAKSVADQRGDLPRFRDDGAGGRVRGLREAGEASLHAVHHPFAEARDFRPDILQALLHIAQHVLGLAWDAIVLDFPQLPVVVLQFSLQLLDGLSRFLVLFLKNLRRNGEPVRRKNMAKLIQLRVNEQECHGSLLRPQAN